MIINKRLLRNWKPKIISLILAILLWGYVFYTQQKSIHINIPVYYKNLPENLTFTGKPNRFIKIEIAGEKEDIKFPTNNLRAEVNLKNAKPGKRKYNINFDLRQIPEKTDIVHIPENVYITLEEKLTKKVWVYPVIKGNSDPQYRIKSITVNPRYIKIQGRKKDITEVTEVRTLPIEINGENTTIHKELGLEKSSKYEILYKKKVQIEIQFYKKQAKREMSEKKLTDIPIHISGTIGKIDIQLSQKIASILISGDKSIVNDITNDHVYAFIIADSAFDACETETEYRIEKIKVHSQLMEKNSDINIQKISPDYVSVICKKKAAATETNGDSTQEKGTEADNSNDETSTQNGDSEKETTENDEKEEN